jgi:thiamine biosynthesis protein ThiI
MNDLILIRYGEIALKGHNRNFFIGLLIRNINRALGDIEHNILKDRGRIFVTAGSGADAEEAIARLSRVFGIVSVSRVIKTDKDIDKIANAAAELVKNRRPQSFKVESRRADKTFALDSPEISRRVGAFILNNCENVRVDVHSPEMVINVEIRDKAYVFSKTEQGPGGLPTGSSGRALLLLSGGIDSPVAGWMLAKRGVEIQAVHYHSFPFTSERAKQKVIDLAHVLNGYTGSLRLHLVSLTDIQREINARCPEEQGTILTRRFMMKIAERIAVDEGLMALITGESLGQVASQTMESLYVTNASVGLPVFRPLIGMDKVEIMQRAREIGTYDLSILPYEDCCTLFLPKHPETKPRVERILQSESHLDVDGLVENAVGSREIIDID